MAIRRGIKFFLQVNPLLCDGYGHCHELAPDLIQLDEWGYPIVDQTPHSYDEELLLESAKYAERGCPRQAIRIRRIK